jgi:hypothetical protein
LQTYNKIESPIKCLSEVLIFHCHKFIFSIRLLYILIQCLPERPNMSSKGSYNRSPRVAKLPCDWCLLRNLTEMEGVNSAMRYIRNFVSVTMYPSTTLIKIIIRKRNLTGYLNQFTRFLDWRHIYILLTLLKTSSYLYGLYEPLFMLEIKTEIKLIH